MLIDFFYTLRAAKLPVSVKEFMGLLEALQAGVVGPHSDDAWSLDDFYYLARTALVKDEKHFDKFDRALRPTSRAWRCWPISPRKSRPTGCARCWSAS